MAQADAVFTMGPSNVQSLLATTLSKYSKQMADNIFNAIPTFAWLSMKNRITEDGGATLVRPVMYAKNSTAQFYSADDLLDTTIQDNFTAAQFQWRQAAASVSITGRIERQNSGSAQVIDYVQAQIQMAEMSIKDKINAALFNATQTGPNITPLNQIVLNSGTVGDINGTTNTWWQSTVQASGSFAARGLADLRTVWNTINVRNPQGPADLILSDQNSFQYYESVLVPSVRINDTKLGDLGFENLKYKAATWTFDTAATSGYAFLLNSKALELVQHANTQFVLSDWSKPANQDLKVAQILWMGELTTNSRRKLGLITGITA